MQSLAWELEGIRATMGHDPHTNESDFGGRELHGSLHGIDHRPSPFTASHWKMKVSDWCRSCWGQKVLSSC